MKFVAALSAIAFLANEVSATCDDTHLDFNDRYRGEYIAFGGYADEGITKIACGTYGGYQDKECRILDTNVGYGSWDVSGAVPNCMANVCTIGNCGSYSNKNKCGDSDLHAPFELANAAGTFESPGNVLIYDEVNTGFSGYTDSQGSSIYPPDDNGAGASMRIEFENPAGVSIKEIDFLDIENSVSRVWFYYTDGSSKEWHQVQWTGNAKMVTQQFNENNVKKIKILLCGSGAIPNIVFNDPGCPPPTSAPVSSPHGGGGGGDPHIQRWGRERFPFHGECDLVLTHSDGFHNNAGLDLHIRTTIQDYYSYIETAALRVGDTILEMHKDYFYVNGVKHTEAELPFVFGGEFKYTINEAEINKHEKNEKFDKKFYRVDLHDDSYVIFKFYKNYLTVSIDGHPADFGDSTGLLGDFDHGEMWGRDGRMIADTQEFGFEWQVSPDEPRLFIDSREPQLPYERCRMPTAAMNKQRKLRGVDLALLGQAAEACSSQQGTDLDLCIEDVMITGDLGLADLW